MVIIENIKENETLTHVGNLIVKGNIGAHANVIIKDGDFTILGNVEYNAHIELLCQEGAKIVSKNSTCIIQANNSFFSGNVNSKIEFASGGKSISVKSQEPSPTNTAQMKTLHINGNVGDNVTIFNKFGDISVGNVGDDCSIHTDFGNIKANNVGDGCVIHTDFGDIGANKVGNSSLTTSLGTISTDNSTQYIVSSTGPSSTSSTSSTSSEPKPGNRAFP